MVTRRWGSGSTDGAQDVPDDGEQGGPGGERGGTTSTPATGVLQLPADRAEASRDAARVLRSMVDARSASTARDDVHLLVDVVLVASALPDPQTALYAAERLHRAIDALPDTGDANSGGTSGGGTGGGADGPDAGTRAHGPAAGTAERPAS